MGRWVEVGVEGRGSLSRRGWPRRASASVMAAWTAAGVAGRDAGGQVRACEECAEARQDYSASAVCILCITDAKWA